MRKERRWVGARAAALAPRHWCSSYFFALPPFPANALSLPLSPHARPLLPLSLSLTRSLRVVIRHLAKPIVGATLNALADLLGGGEESKRDVAALAIQAISADERLAGPGKGTVDGALVEVLLPRMIGIAEKKVRGWVERRGQRASARKPTDRARLSSNPRSISHPPLSQDPLESATAALDAIHEVIARHGHLASAQHPALTACLLGALADPRAGPRRRATAGLAALAASLDDEPLGGAVDEVLARLEAALAGSGGAAVHSDVARGQVAALGALARAAGWRFGAGRVGRAVPALLSVLAVPGDDPPDDDRREASLHALEALASRVPAALASPPHAEAVLAAAGAALRHDPNFDDGGGGGVGDDGMSGGEGDGGGDACDDGLEDEDEDDDAYSIDDQDTAWKVRRAGARLLAAMAGAAAASSAGSDAAAASAAGLAAAYPSIIPPLVSRFTEREEAVRADVFAAFADVVRLIGVDDAAGKALAAAAAAAAGEVASGAGTASATPPPDAPPSTAAALLAADTPAIARAVARQWLRSRSPAARQGALGAVSSLIPVVPAAFASVAPVALLPAILGALGETGTASAAGGLQVSAATALRAALSAPGTAAAWRPHAPAIAAALATAAGERYYKLAAGALRAGEGLARVLRPDEVVAAMAAGQQPGQPGTDAAAVRSAALPLLSAAAARLAQADVDAEVREAAIGTVSALLARAGRDAFAGEAAPVLGALVGALGSEAGRAPAARAVAAVAAAPLRPAPLDPATFTGPACEALTGFLRLESRPLRVASLAALAALARTGEALPPGAAAAAAAAAAPLLAGGDLGLAAPALRLGTALLAAPGAAQPVAASLAQPALALATSPLLQGPALGALTGFLAALATSGAAGGAELVPALLAAGRGVGRPAQAAIATCVATLCVAGGPGLLESTVKGLLAAAGKRAGGTAEEGGGAGAPVAGAGGRGSCKAGKASAAATAPVAAAASAAAASDPGSARLALLCVGEVGRAVDLSGVAGLAPTLTAAMGDPAEDVASAAAAALGGASVRAPTDLLPGLLDLVRGGGGAREQYLLLSALNAAMGGLDAAGAGVDGLVGGGAATADAPLAPPPPPLPQALRDDIRTLLLSAAESAADGEVRAAAAEGLGALTRLDPASVLPALVAASTAPAPALRAAAVAAARHAIPSGPHPAVEAALAGGPLLTLLRLGGDPDHRVRQAAVQALAAAAHHRPALVARLLREGGGPEGAGPSLMDLLLAATALDESLVRVVDLGPFKHRVDDGLDLRKAAYECLDGLLDRPPTRAALDAPAALTCLEGGLADVPDIKLPCMLLLVKLAAAAPGATRAAVDRLLPPLDAAIMAKPPASAVQQEVDRADDLARAALRAVDALGRVPGVAATPAYRAYVAGLAAGPAAPKWAAVREEGRAAGLEAAVGGGAAGVWSGAGGAGGAEAMDTT